MPIVQAKCTNCGASLKVDNTKDAAICEFCGSAYIVEKAINNYDITNHNIINADVVNIYNSNSNTSYHSKSSKTTVDQYIHMIDKAGTNRLLSPNCLSNLLLTTNENPCDKKSIILLNKLDNYCNNLDFKFNFDYVDYVHLDSRYSYQAIWESANYDKSQNDGNNFYDWIDAETESFSGIYEKLKIIQKKMTDYYIKLIKDGLADAWFTQSFGKEITLWGVKANKYGVFIDVDKYLKNKFLLPYFIEGLKNANNYELNRTSRAPYLFCLGKFDIHWDFEYSNYTVTNQSYYLININKERVDKYKKQRVCQYCGGEFKGLLKKTCSKCGNPKDY